jgi:hypothetical protein
VWGVRLLRGCQPGPQPDYTPPLGAIRVTAKLGHVHIQLTMGGADVQFWSPASAQPRSKYPLNHCTVPLHAAKHTLMSKLCCQVLLALGRVGESEGRGRGSLLRTPPSSHSQPPTPWASMGRQERRRPDRKSVLDKAMLLRELQKSGSLELLGLIAAKLTSKQMPVGLHSQSACCQQGGGGSEVVANQSQKCSEAPATAQA